MSEISRDIGSNNLSFLPLYQVALNAGIGGMSPDVVRLSGDTKEWSKVVAEAKQRPDLEDLLSGIRVVRNIGEIDSEQIYHYLWGLSLAGKLVRELNTGIYRIEPRTKIELYQRNIARLSGKEERIALLSGELEKLAA
jgi:hypothetical protein